MWNSWGTPEVLGVGDNVGLETQESKHRGLAVWDSVTPSLEGTLQGQAP